jgi:hypothetical protein
MIGDDVMSILQAELLIPQLEFLNEEGAQAELWALSKIFLDTLAQETGQVWIQGRFSIRHSFYSLQPTIASLLP